MVSSSLVVFQKTVWQEILPITDKQVFFIYENAYTSKLCLKNAPSRRGFGDMDTDISLISN
jgi:hypothetical protein